MGFATTAGIYLDSLAAASAGNGNVLGTIVIPVGFTTFGSNLNPQFTAKVSPFPILNVNSGAPFTLVPIAFGGTMQAAGAGGMTIQLQTTAGVAVTEAINVAALVQFATFQSQTLNFTAGQINPGANLNIVTVNAPAALCWLEVLRVEE